MTPLFHLQDVVRRYGTRVALHLTHLDVYPGEILGLRGHNGSGKSTLLRLLALLESPDSGTFLFQNSPARPDDLLQRRQVTLLLQTPYLLSRSVEANIAYGLQIRGIHASDRIGEALAAVGLDPSFLSRRRHELSGGEAQRVALASRLALHPRVLLMDEPTSNVDEASAARIAHAARSAAQNDAAVVIASHDRDWIEGLADRTLLMRDGQIDG